MDNKGVLASVVSISFSVDSFIDTGFHAIPIGPKILWARSAHDADASNSNIKNCYVMFWPTEPVYFSYPLKPPRSTARSNRLSTREV